MTAGTKHIIQRVNLEVNAPDREVAMHLKDHLGQFLIREVFPLLEMEINKLEAKYSYGSKDKIKISRIEVELSGVSPGLARSKDKLIAAIVEQISQAMAGTHPHAIRVTEEENDVEVFVHFMRYGTLPDNNSNTRWQLTSAMLERLVRVPGFVAKFKELMKNRAIKERFFNQLSPAQVDYLVKHTWSEQEAAEVFSVDNELLSVDDEPDKEQYISNAGLVILHPYLKTFFERCHLLNSKQQLVDPELAAHLLHYLATQKEGETENRMVFEKYLCGIPLGQSIAREVALSEEHKEQSEALLQSVLDHWKVLRNSSPDLLRHEYLQRMGKINITPSVAQVHIERKTQDILLDKLPWGISMFKLAWLEPVVMVTW